MPAGVVYRDGNGGLALRRFVSGFSLVTEEHRPAGMIVSNPVEQHLPDIRFRGPATVVRIQPSQRTAKGEAEVLRVVRFRHDDDLGTALHGEWTPPPEFVERWRGRRREVVLKLEYPDGGWCDIRLLRTLKWIGQEGVRVGVTVFLDLSETGTRGWAEVMDILPCGPVEVGPGEMVTGTFKHSHGTIGELVLESETKPIGVTPGHLFWSEDRRAWVPVASLRRGETLRTSAGTTQVVSYTLTDKVEPVYNLEVEHDHCYRVGESGVLVHNQSGPGGQPQSVQQQCGCAARLAEYRRQGFTPSRMIREEGISQTDHYLWWLACNIAHAAGVAPQQGSTPVVSVALVCEDGSDKFTIYVSYNLLRGADAVRRATEAVLGPGHWIAPQPPVHSEDNIVAYFQGAQHRGEIAGIAASRCICPGCVAILAAGTNRLASPRGSRAVPTCNLDGTPAVSQARQWCQSGMSPIPFNQQF